MYQVGDDSPDERILAADKSASQRVIHFLTQRFVLEIMRHRTPRVQYGGILSYSDLVRKRDVQSRGRIKRIVLKSDIYYICVCKSDGESYMVVVAPWKTKVAFPAAQVEACIRDELQSQADDQALLRPGVASAIGPRDSWEPEIDSLVVIEVICSIEELLGVSLPDSFVPRGGYQTVEDCVRDLLAETQSVWVALNKKDEDDEG